jgi:hypothetical protein
MRLVIVAVGEKYVADSIPYIREFVKKGWEVDILTDSIDKFEFGNLHEYVNKIFFFTEKVLFPLRMCEKHKDDILFSDVDFLKNLNDEFIDGITNNENVLYIDNWEKWNGNSWDKWVMVKEMDHSYFKPLYDYLGNDDIETIVEWCLFIPYSEKISSVIHDVEMFKPILEYMSVIGEHKYQALGGGEGLSLSYALKKNGIKTQKFGEINK